MFRNTCILVFLALIVLSYAAAPSAVADTIPYDIPRLDNITIDGDAADWASNGFCINVLSSEQATTREPVDFDAKTRLAWNDEGLLILCIVSDDNISESEKDDELGTADSIQLFVAPSTITTRWFEVAMAPGVSPDHPALRTYTFDRQIKQTPNPPFDGKAARTAIAGGYQLEVMIPWSWIRITPAVDQQFVFQINVNDLDPNEDKFILMWYPKEGTYGNPGYMNTLRLAEKPSAPVEAAVRGGYEDGIRTKLDVVAASDLAGKEVTIKCGKEKLATAELKPATGHSQATVTFGFPPAADMGVFVGKKQLTPFSLEDPAAFRARAVLEAEFGPKPTDMPFGPKVSGVFIGKSFPRFDFDKPLEAQQWLGGPYTVSAVFYDRNFNEVTEPKEIGRYGAVVTIAPENGQPLTRYCTLCYLKDESYLFALGEKYNPQVSGTFPELLGIDPAVTKCQSQYISECFKQHLMDGSSLNQAGAMMLCGLMEAKPTTTPASVAESFMTLDHQWWLELKQRLYGVQKVAMLAPTKIDGAPATVLHKGTLADAGMKPDAVKNIDAVCNAWAADTDESFAVCIARHGVIVLEKAYGMRDGRPMTLEDKSLMASITKMISASLMWMAVDQGLVNLDDPVSKYLPPLRDAKVKKEMTIRELYTHTAGLSGHWGDDLNDFEHLVGYQYPYLNVAQKFEYDGAGPALGTRVLEVLTGESLALLYQNHLFGPLGMKNIDSFNSSGWTFSAPRAIATFGQMVLNGGAYGDLRFFKPETLAQMRPQKLSMILGADTDVIWGIGTDRTTDEGMSPSAYGHGAASSAMFTVDPENDLVIVMTRNWAGKNFENYHPKFIKAVTDGIQK